jgi:acyl dehydratase
MRIDSVANLKDLAGQEIGVSDWLTIAQERIQQFADATGDHQWIHVDTERASRESPFASTIAHGFLTLSLVSYFQKQVLQIGSGIRMAINYGLNRVRFTAPVRAGSKIRGRFAVQTVKELPDGVEVVFAVTVESADSSKPCCVAEWLVRYYS